MLVVSTKEIDQYNEDFSFFITNLIAYLLALTYNCVFITALHINLKLINHQVAINIMYVSSFLVQIESYVFNYKLVFLKFTSANCYSLKQVDLRSKYKFITNITINVVHSELFQKAMN